MNVYLDFYIGFSSSFGPLTQNAFVEFRLSVHQKYAQFAERSMQKHNQNQKYPYMHTNGKREIVVSKLSACGFHVSAHLSATHKHMK